MPTSSILICSPSSKHDSALAIGLAKGHDSLRLRLNKNDWTIGCQHLGRNDLGLERSSEIVYRRPVGVIVDDAQPQRGIPLVAGQCSWNVVCLLGVGLGTKARSEVTVWLARINVKAHVNRRQRYTVPDSGASSKLKNLATWSRYQARCSSVLSPFKRSRAIDLSGTTGMLRNLSMFSVL